MSDGIHTCVAKKRISNASKQGIIKAIQNNPKVAPNRLINNEMVKIMLVMLNDDFNWQDVESAAVNYVDIKAVENLKQKFKHKLNPLGENFEALGLFRKNVLKKMNS